MGEVWLAQDNELHDQVALKILSSKLSTAPGMVELLRHECRRTRHLNHPHIVRIYDFHVVEQCYFISMEYIEGGDLRRFVGHDFRHFLPQLLQIANALQYAHGLGIVHRDIKASNVLCNVAGSVRLTDFGIAAVIQGEKTAPTLTSGGSLYSMSPQQLTRQDPNPSDDIYAFGALIYELVTGSPPFYPDITRDKVLSSAPAPMRAHHPIPEQLASLVASMLAKSPADRPETMADVQLKLGEMAADYTIPPQVDESKRPPELFPRGRSDVTIPPQTPGDGRSTGEGLEPITPLSRTVAAVPKRGARGSSQNMMPAIWAWIGLSLLLVAAIGVFYYLPESLKQEQMEDLATESTQLPNVTAPNSIPSQTSARPASGPSPWEQAQLTRARQEAEKILEEFLNKQSNLESMAVTTWAAQEFDAAKAKAAEGDGWFRRGEFAAAAKSYTEGVAILDGLIEQSATVLKSTLTAGWEAFEDRNAAKAADAFQLALKIDPGNEEATKGLARAGTLDQVLVLLDSGYKYEKDGELSLAQADFRQATELDPEFEEAREALSRVSNKIQDTQFGQAMSAGFAALERKDYEAARKAFNDARKLKPNSKEPLDGLAQVERNLRLEKIAKYRKTGAALEKQERWREAIKQYSAALKLDATLVFAKQGRARSLRRAELSESLDAYIKQPERLGSDKVLRSAEVLQAEAAAITNKGPKLRRKLATLSRLIEIARTPVRVRLQSDNMTNVVVYKVGRLGSFRSHELVLRPGTYTVVGSRDGYRDVRRQFTVVAGKTLPPVVVRCEERI